LTYHFTVKVECSFTPDASSLLELALGDSDTIEVDGEHYTLDESNVFELPESTLQAYASRLFEDEAMQGIEDNGNGISTGAGNVDLGTPWMEDDANNGGAA
jgi:hypothetical protein